MKSAAPAHARPFRRADRRGRVPSGLARAARPRRGARPALVPWREPRPGAHVARAAAFITLAEVEAGVGCPLSMTFAALPALRAEPRCRRVVAAAHFDGLRPRAAAGRGQDRRPLRHGDDRTAGRLGRARERDRAQPVADDEATLHGHKWFCSAPMCDVFLVLAQAPGGLTCYLLPRVLPDGERNAFHIDRLKDKLGNRSNASAEITSRRRVGAARRRGGPRRRDDHRDGRAHAARLCARIRRPDAARGRGGDAPRRAPRGVRPPARRAAADGERARRPVRRLRSGDAARAAARARLRRGGRARSGAWRRRSRSTGSARRRRRSSPRRSSASAATATSRRACCRASTARAR